MNIEAFGGVKYALKVWSGQKAFLDQIDAHHLSPRKVIYLSVDKRNLDIFEKALCALRAESIGAILLLEQTDTSKLPLTALEQSVEKLKAWDQLFIHNLLILLGEYLPLSLLDSLKSEATTELKWFHEWFAAESDPRIHKYPPMPWRSFIRKINQENLEFAKLLMAEMKSQKSEACLEENDESARLVSDFLQQKKKVLCLFPKRWKAKTEK